MKVIYLMILLFYTSSIISQVDTIHYYGEGKNRLLISVTPKSFENDSIYSFVNQERIEVVFQSIELEQIKLKNYLSLSQEYAKKILKKLHFENIDTLELNFEYIGDIPYEVFNWKGIRNLKICQSTLFPSLRYKYKTEDTLELEKISKLFLVGKIDVDFNLINALEVSDLVLYDILSLRFRGKNKSVDKVNLVSYASDWKTIKKVVNYFPKAYIEITHPKKFVFPEIVEHPKPIYWR